MIRYYADLGVYLREARLRAGFSQKEVAHKLGYSSGQFISNFERGIVTPPLKKTNMLIRLYGIDADRVIDELIKAEQVRLAQAFGVPKKVKRKKALA